MKEERGKGEDSSPTAPAVSPKKYSVMLFLQLPPFQGEGRGGDGYDCILKEKQSGAAPRHDALLVRGGEGNDLVALDKCPALQRAGEGQSLLAMPG